MFRKIIPTIILVVLFSVRTFSGGFQINEHGAKAMAMAGAFVGLANDPSAVWFNPAGITQLPGTHLMVGATFILPNSKFTGSGWTTSATEMESQIFYPINFYFTHQFTDDLFFGVSVNNPYGLGTTWPANWDGRFVAYKSDMKTFFVNPVIAYKVSDAFSIAVGGIFAYGEVTIEQKTFLGMLPTGQPLEGTTSLEGNGTAYGFTAGVLFKPSENFQWGLSYKSQTKFDFEGTAVTDPASIPVTIPGLGTISYPLPSGGIVAKFTTPWVVSFGLATKASDKFTITADAQLTGWASFDTLAVDFNEYNNNPLDPTSGLLKLRDPKKYNNSYILRLGGEYQYTEDFAIRGGILYDYPTAPDKYVEASLPDAADWGFNIGFGYKLSQNFTIDFGYMFLLYPKRTVNDSEVDNGWPQGLPASFPSSGYFNGSYETTAHLFALDILWSL